MQISLLPVDLGRWDRSPGGELLAVPVFADVRPLRGAAGLLDWRLNGWLSRCLRDERFQGAPGEKLLLPGRRIPWRAVLAIGAGAAADAGATAQSQIGGSADPWIARCRAWLDTLFVAAAGLRLRTVAAALPGRESDRLLPDHALAAVREAARQRDPAPVDALTLIDSPAALKVLSEALGLSGPRALAARATTRPAQTGTVAGTRGVQPAARAPAPGKPPSRSR